MPTQEAHGTSRALRQGALARVAGAYAAMLALLTAIAAWGQSLVPTIAVGNRSTINTDDPFWVDPWVRWDSNWYGGIAENGYAYTPGQQSGIAFFPSYPMAIRGLTEVTGDHQVSGVLITLRSAVCSPCWPSRRSSSASVGVMRPMSSWSWASPSSAARTFWAAGVTS